MYRGRALRVVLIVSLAALIVMLAGCGGSNGPRLPGVVPPGGGAGGVVPPAGTAAVAGTVIDAQNVGTRLVGVLVAVLGFGQPILTDAAGNFIITGVPPGQRTLDISFPSTGLYQAMRITIDTVANQTTTVTISALGTNVNVPNSVTIAPSNPSVDIGGEIAFTADARSLGVPANVAPTYSVLGGVGTILPDGRFTALAIGTGTVTAHFPDASAAATVTVVGARAPNLGILNVSPNALPSNGGNVRIAVTATDGDGIKSAVAQLELPNRTLITMPLSRETGTTKDGSWGGTYNAGANTNLPGPDGKQLEQRYSVRVIVEDNSSAITNSVWVDFVVASVDAPPPPP